MNNRDILIEDLQEELENAYSRLNNASHKGITMTAQEDIDSIEEELRKLNCKL